MSGANDVLLQERAGPVLWLTLNRPERLNALTPEMMGMLAQALEQAQADEQVSVIVLTGAGERAFAAGNDVERLAGMDVAQAHQDMRMGQKVVQALHESMKPTVAMVNGYALGGGFELALACDFIVASEQAVFGFPEITLATMPGWGGTQLAVMKMGLARAKDMVLSGEHRSARQCMDYGFIHSLAAHAELRSATDSFVQRISAHPALALGLAKTALNRAAELPLHSGMEFEAALYASNFGMPHARSGLQDFLLRRAAKRK
ncbi:enoyl-CoA hydratase/isomerase family protein [Paracandidimonas soli]|uniref:Short chain enoyl-CoA hydratase n=1 Tax=Paracandidimonas soli TaxID=1917182 RepID=A0A4R3V563_9BURK|nr:enoyl-CoA hydratase/isomerase family protein [Paracandidimonas soli]TCU98437.1 short chain enoyl-CoA hydratase [Paracandidimonas soli]